MKTAIIGGGKGCKAILEMVAEGTLMLLQLDIIGVVDPNMDASGMVFAREKGWDTMTDMKDVLTLPGLELVIELTGEDNILEELYRLMPHGIRVMDHVLAEVFWDLDKIMFELADELNQKISLEEQLRKDRRQLQQLIDGLPDAILVVDRDMNLERVNARFTEMTGFGPEELKEQKCLDPFCAKHMLDGGEDAICAFEEVLKTKKSLHFIRLDRREDYDEVYYDITVSPMFDEEGDIIRMVATARPITEEVMLKRETEESEQRFRQFIDNVHDMITMKNVGGQYLVVNPPAAELFGMRPEDLLGKTDFDIFPRKIAQSLTGKDKIALDTGEYQVIEEKLRIKGEMRYLSTVRFPLFDYKGDISGVCSIARDVTEQERLQRAVLQSEKFAAMGKLAAGVAHELNNPLTGILTFAEELKMDADPNDPLFGDYETIVREAMRCRRIVRDLLDYARLEKPQRKNRNLNDVIERSLSLVQKQASFHDVKFVLDLGENLPEVSIDSNQMQQVFLNLIINAGEAMNSAGKITISSRITGEGSKVEVAVSDEGHGIPADKLRQIFEPFFSTKGQQGNGLGLNVVQTIVDQHSGKMKVDSKVGEGTTFTVILPVGREESRRTAHG